MLAMRLQQIGPNEALLVNNNRNHISRNATLVVEVVEVEGPGFMHSSMISLSQAISIFLLWQDSLQEYLIFYSCFFLHLLLICMGFEY